MTRVRGLFGLMSAAQAADELGLDVKTVQRQLRDGVLKGQKLGRDWVVDRRAVAAYRADHLGRPGPRARTNGKNA